MLPVSRSRCTPNYQAMPSGGHAPSSEAYCTVLLKIAPHNVQKSTFWRTNYRSSEAMSFTGGRVHVSMRQTIVKTYVESNGNSRLVLLVCNPWLCCTGRKRAGALADSRTRARSILHIYYRARGVHIDAQAPCSTSGSSPECSTTTVPHFYNFTTSSVMNRITS